MKKLLILVLAFSFIYNLNSQTSWKKSNTINCKKLPAENYIEYQRGITKAENLMFDSLFHESVKQYKTTFDSYSFNFPRDCMIAAQAATYIEDNASALYFLKKAVRFGVTKEHLRRIRLFEKLSDNTFQLLFMEYDSLRNEYFSNLNLPYRELCNELRLKEQALHAKDQGVVNGRFTDNAFFSTNRYLVWKPSIRKEWQNYCLKAVETIDSLIPQYGFPSYRTIGVVDSVTFTNKALSSCQILMIYYHYLPYKKSTIDMSILYNEVVKGNLSARDYATMYEFYLRKSAKYRKNKSLYYVRWDVPPIPDKIYPNEDVANINREEIGLSNCYYERVRKLWQHDYYNNKPYSFELFYYDYF